MGNCCGSTTTSDDGIIEAKYISPEGERPSPVNSPQQPSYSEAVQGHMTPESVPDITLPADEEQLEHMADREDLTNKDGTMFLEKSKNARKLMVKNGRSHTYSGRKRHSSARMSLVGGVNSSPVLIKKANSCSTIYTDDSTVSQPNLKSSLKCVSLAIFYHIKNRVRSREPWTLPIFDEKIHPLTRAEVPSHYGDYTPDHKVIYKFIKTLFHAAQLTAECAIITLIYLERLLHYSDLDLHPSNWKRILLGAILLASKVWDDQAGSAAASFNDLVTVAQENSTNQTADVLASATASFGLVWNVDYCQILRDITVEDMNELERVYLEQLQFNINVLSSVYAKYYFDLRSLAEDNGLSFPSEYEPLTKERAKKLEALTRATEDKLTNYKLRKSNSSEPFSPKNKLVLM